MTEMKNECKALNQVTGSRRRWTTSAFIIGNAIAASMVIMVLAIELYRNYCGVEKFSPLALGGALWLLSLMLTNHIKVERENGKDRHE